MFLDRKKEIFSLQIFLLYMFELSVAGCTKPQMYPLICYNAIVHPTTIIIAI